MQLLDVPGIVVENKKLQSAHLGREVAVDFYLPSDVADPASLHLLVINDGQNMEEMGLAKILSALTAAGTIPPILCAAIHCGPERRFEYGVAGIPDYLGRGNKADAYTSFITSELLPYIGQEFLVPSFRSRVFAGFSLGGLSALDIVWNNPQLFNIAAVFSGSLWWRSVDQDDPAYRDDEHRIMHQVIRHGTYRPGLRFFFQSGNMDETHDRNNNGIIDSIDDTLDLISELRTKGYQHPNDIAYVEMPEGRHDIATWGLAFPGFLTWAWGPHGD